MGPVTASIASQDFHLPRYNRSRLVTIAPNRHKLQHKYLYQNPYFQITSLIFDIAERILRKLLFSIPIIVFIHFDNIEIVFLYFSFLYKKRFQIIYEFSNHVILGA